ncbi:MAG: alpha/beta hydrolase [Cyclobacteriaceae bacterium]|jgi:pimeloyl-ACP methyl ester carboxylesterase|nr:alpha/beta hydrolase [Flammeovirgaceae bacterium]MCZ8021563.1 alpha/beta hydrolase [Cytophagales bacterium]MCZ8327846.1 alpha/beta hydrolase [Cyclobacteriaceae bacterium]
MKVKKWLILSTVVAISVIVQACLTFRMSSGELKKYFNKKKVNYIRTLSAQGKRNLHYVQTGDTSRQTIVFVHGSPGSYSAFIDFLSDSTLLASYCLVSVDRPGFGYSNFGLAEPSINNQADFFVPLLERLSNKKVILVGHSLGGPLVANLAMRYPHLVRGIVLVAASVDPELEPNERWFRVPLRTPFMRWILPPSMRASNDELCDLKFELQNMVPLWQNITCPVAIVHGEKDSLVPFGNVKFIEENLPKHAPLSLFTKKDMNHFVPWSNPELIREAIDSLASSFTQPN